MRVVELATRDIGYDPAAKRIFASCDSSVRGRENTITLIDPIKVRICESVFVGSEPTRIAMAEDGKTLYVVLDGARSLCRFDLRKKRPQAAFPIRTPALEDMYVPAGHPNWVVMSMFNPGYSPRHGGGALYIDGKEVPGGYQWGPNVFVRTPDGDHVYGVYNELGGSPIGRRSIGPKGWGSAEPFIGVSENAEDIKYEDGKLYASSGRIYDFDARTLLGTCTGGGGLVAPASEDDRVYFLQNAGGTWRFHAFDTRRFVSQGWMDMPEVTGTPRRLIKLGRGRYAFRTDNRVYLIGLERSP